MKESDRKSIYINIVRTIMNKAFDTVSHEQIERTLRYYNVPNFITEKIMEIYQDNKATIS